MGLHTLQPVPVCKKGVCVCVWSPKDVHNWIKDMVIGATGNADQVGIASEGAP